MQATFLRTFFAIDLPEDSKKQLADYSRALKSQLEKQYKRKHFRWVKPDNIHITLQFLGRVKAADLRKLWEAVDMEIKQMSAFNVQLGPLEWFPSRYKPHVLSLQTQAQAQLAALSAAIGKGIIQAGYAIEERHFRAHVTLARVEYLSNMEQSVLASFNLPALPVIPVEAVVFFKSEPERGGSLYTQLKSLSLSRQRV